MKKMNLLQSRNPENGPTAICWGNAALENLSAFPLVFASKVVSVTIIIIIIIVVVVVVVVFGRWWSGCGWTAACSTASRGRASTSWTTAPPTTWTRWTASRRRRTCRRSRTCCARASKPPASSRRTSPSRASTSSTAHRHVLSRLFFFLFHPRQSVRYRLIDAEQFFQSGNGETPWKQKITLPVDFLIIYSQPHEMAKSI